MYNFNNAKFSKMQSITELTVSDSELYMSWRAKRPTLTPGTLRMWARRPLRGYTSRHRSK
jgi:hypothetical protein